MRTPQGKTTVQATPYDRSFRPLFNKQQEKNLDNSQKLTTSYGKLSLQQLV
jgi:hypothetical protein